MQRRKLELFMIEYAMTVLQGECKSFSKFYKTDLFSVEYEMKKDHGVAYLITPDEKIKLATIYFKDVAYVIHHAFEITEEPFMGLCTKYNLAIDAGKGEEIND